MRAVELDDVEESLGIVLPDSYRDILRRVASRPLRGMLAELVCTDAQKLIELNQYVGGWARPVAGLPDWPDDLFVIGDDGCGNYYAIRHAEDDSPVLFFDHEADELQQCARSIQDFCKRINALAPFDQKVLHRGYRPQRSRSVSIPAVVPSFRDQPGWTRSWTIFVKEFSKIAAKNPGKPTTIRKLNRTFGSKAVRWIGRVHSLNLGKYPHVRIAMPSSRASAPFPRLDRLNLGVRWAAHKQAPGISNGNAGTPQVLTSSHDWREIRPGYRIQFLMMFAPGLKGDISCVEYHDIGDESYYSIKDCGAHALRIVEKSRLTRNFDW
jgi:SMI1/KNR4 family protein SUKH-1